MAQQHGTARVSDVDWSAGWGEPDRLPSAAFAPPAAPSFSPDAGALHDPHLPDYWPDYWQGRADGQREPMALVDTAGRVVRTTSAFDAALRNREGAGAALTLRGVQGDAIGRRLRAAISIDQPALDAAIARAVRAVAPVATATRCPRRDGGAPLIVTLQPLSRSVAAPGRPPRRDAPGPIAVPAATLTLIDPLARPPAATRLWCEAFDLTPSEAAVAALLVAGHSLESAAATRGSRATTLRVHLRHLFAKTGTARQSDLVALLLRMG
jgi:DNA-binding CsgD family transcriptional regulator